MKNNEKIYNYILELNHNIEPSILTFGSLLFDFLLKDNSFNIKTFNREAENYMLYSAENICKTYEWLKNNGLIYYSKAKNKYFATDKILRLKLIKKKK